MIKATHLFEVQRRLLIFWRVFFLRLNSYHFKFQPILLLLDGEDAEFGSWGLDKHAFVPFRRPRVNIEDLRGGGR